MNLGQINLILSFFLFRCDTLKHLQKLWYGTFHLSEYHIIKGSRDLWGWVSFINASLVTLALITLVWEGHVTWRNGTPSFWYAEYVFPANLVVVAFLKVVLWSFSNVTWSPAYFMWHLGMVPSYSDIYS